MKAEENIQIAVCDYLRYQYPKVMFTCDLASGMKLTVGQAVKAKRMRSCRAWPDIFISEPRKECHGLFIELKREGTRLTKRNGEHSSEHIAEQSEVIDELNRRGYASTFAVGLIRLGKLLILILKANENQTPETS